MRHSDFIIGDNGTVIRIGTKHQHTIPLPRAMARAEVHRLLRAVEGVTSIRPASVVANEVRQALGINPEGVKTITDVYGQRWLADGAGIDPTPLVD